MPATPGSARQAARVHPQEVDPFPAGFDMVRSSLKGALAGIGFFAASQAAQAAPADTEVVTSIKIGDLAAILGQMGLRDLKPNTAGNGLISEYKGIPFGVYLSGCTGGSCTDLEIEAFYGKQNPSPKFLLAFNKHYVPRLIAKEDGKTFIWMPLHFEDGVTVKFLKYTIALALDASDKVKTYQLDD